MALGLSELREQSLIDQSEMNILLQQFHELREKVFERKNAMRSLLIPDELRTGLLISQPLPR